MGVRNAECSVAHKGLSHPQYLQHSGVYAGRAVGHRGVHLGMRLEIDLMPDHKKSLMAR